MNEATYFNDVMIVWELRGNYPQDIPTFGDVDIQELTKGDDDPMFLTLPIGKVNSKSINGRFYDEAWIQELERQTAEQRPIGIMGHLREEELATAFPPEAIHWVGVQRIGEMLWGKGYVPPGEARERVRRYKATNKKLATSIFAEARGAFDKAVGALRMAADSLKLKQIDIGPADRVGIPGLATEPIITAEMGSPEGSKDPENEKENDMDKYEVIREMTADDAKLLPDNVREAVLATVTEPPEVALVAELREALGVDEKADPVAIVKEMKTEREKQAKRAVSDRIKELVEDEEKGVKLESARGIVMEMIELRAPATPDEAETVFKEVVESDRVKGLLSEMVQATMGPRQRTPAQPQNGANGSGKYFQIPKEDES